MNKGLILLAVLGLMLSGRADGQTAAVTGNPTPATQKTSAAFDPGPPFSSPANVYSGVSGPGKPVSGNGWGGYRSGYEGVMVQGPDPLKPGWHPLGYQGTGGATGSAVQAGLIPPLKPLWEIHLRDTIINLGGDGNYYMTGSSGDNIWDRNDGIELWRSADLKKWDYVGLVWSFDRDATWQNVWSRSRKNPNNVRFIWAPEIHYIKGNYYLTACVGNGGVGTFILKSTTGKPDGPYKSPLVPDRRMGGGIDATLFEDDDGAVYFTSGGAGTITKMKDDMSGFDGPPHKIEFERPADGSWPTRPSIAQEGASLFKRNGKYYLGGAAFYKGRYSSVVAISDQIYGPYKQWHEAVPCGGGTNYFKDKDGNWWCAYFGNDEQSPFREKPGALRIDFAPDGRIVVAKNQPDFVLATDRQGIAPAGDIKSVNNQ